MSLEGKEANTKVKNNNVAVKTGNIEQVDKYWQVTVQHPRGGLADSMFYKLSEFGVI